MSEIAPSLPTEPLFRANVLSLKDVMVSKENAAVLAWYKEACQKLPEMRVSMTPVKESKDIRSNPSFFSIANVDVTTPVKSWQQGGLIQRGEMLPTQNGETISSHGSAILLVDPEGNTFVTVSQEPMAPARHRSASGILQEKPSPGSVEIHPVVRTPMQTSAEKLKRITIHEHEGRKADATMTTILYGLAKDRNQKINAILGSVSLSPSMTDGNRMQSDILYGALAVTDGEAKKIAASVPSGRWVSPRELDALTIMGATNGTLNIARNIVETQRRVTNTKTL